jgi:hypothetical protein
MYSNRLSRPVRAGIVLSRLVLFVAFSVHLPSWNLLAAATVEFNFASFVTSKDGSGACDLPASVSIDVTYTGKVTYI